MFKISLYLVFYICIALLVNSESLFSENNDNEGELNASKCSEEYENCGVWSQTMNVTDSTILNATSNSNYDEMMQKTVKVSGYCCPGLICKNEGYDEEPLPPGVTHWCADPENDLNRERMFDKWKKSLEMPPNYSY